MPSEPAAHGAKALAAIDPRFALSVRARQSEPLSDRLRVNDMGGSGEGGDGDGGE